MLFSEVLKQNGKANNDEADLTIGELHFRIQCEVNYPDPTESKKVRKARISWLQRLKKKKWNALLLGDP